MANREKDIFDQIDDLFSQLNGEQIVDDIIKGVDTVSTSINEALKNNGYDNMNEFYQGAIRDQKGRKPMPKSSFRKYDSRVAYVKDTLSHIEYEIKYRGYYREGHQEACMNALRYLDSYHNDLDLLASRVKQEANQTRIHMRNRKDAYSSGYINGCEYVLSAIEKSKKMMMQEILHELKV